MMVGLTVWKRKVLTIFKSMLKNGTKWEACTPQTLDSQNSCWVQDWVWHDGGLGGNGDLV